MMYIFFRKIPNAETSVLWSRSDSKRCRGKLSAVANSRRFGAQAALPAPPRRFDAHGQAQSDFSVLGLFLCFWVDGPIYAVFAYCENSSRSTFVDYCLQQTLEFKFGLSLLILPALTI